MTTQVLIVHDKNEEHLAEKLAEPLRDAGYQVVHQGTIMVGQSREEEVSKVLGTGAPLVLCGTVRAVGTQGARRVINAARQYSGVRVFIVQMEEEADVNSLAYDEIVALYWQDSVKAIRDLVASLQKYYPSHPASDKTLFNFDIERRYRELTLKACDIIDLVNLPENDRDIVTKRLELRRLYVALRVQVEVPFGSEVINLLPEPIEKRWNALCHEKPYEGSPINKPEDYLHRIPIGQRLSETKRLVVLGDPGAGKTTIIRWIATAYLLRLKQDSAWKDLPDIATLPDVDWLPVVIRCRDLDQTCLTGSLDDILCLVLRKIEMRENEYTTFRTTLSEKLSKGQVLLLLDGLDEIPEPAARTRFCKQIEQISIAYPNATIIATSRIVGYREMGYRIGQGFEHVTVTDLSQEDKDDFARRWCEVTELPERWEKAAEELIQDIHSTERIERLTGNPMLLTTMALVKRKMGKILTHRADLYNNAVEVLLNWRREIDEPIDDHEAFPQLEYIAYTMCDRNVPQLREDEIINLFEQMREEYPQIHAVKKHSPEDFLQLLERRTGILVKAGYVRHNGRPVPVYEFRHLTFQEYLAGLALLAGRFPRRVRSNNLADNVAPLAGRTSEVQNNFGGKEVVVTEHWREALRLCVTTCNDDDADRMLMAILKPLAGEDAELTARPRAVLAALCLADEPNTSDPIVLIALKEFARQINETDGCQYMSSLDAAVKELAKSSWAEMLRFSLEEEFQKRDAEIQERISSLCAMIQQTCNPIHTLNFS
jgi:hypothetical protein